MKVITEAIVRNELKTTRPEVYYIPEGKLLSPAAREYLQSLQIDIDFEKNRSVREAEGTSTPLENIHGNDKKATLSDKDASTPSPKYVDYETGAGYISKPEHMTQLYSNKLVDKCHPRIKYRGKIDSLEALIINAQCIIKANDGPQMMIDDLDNILEVVGNLMRCEVLDEPVTNEYILGFNHAELRERSHFPMKYYKIKQLLLPNYNMGIEHAQLNVIRAAIRECEVIAVEAFRQSRAMDRSDVIEELNRLSSALHIMMCKDLAGEYDNK